MRLRSLLPVAAAAVLIGPLAAVAAPAPAAVAFPEKAGQQGVPAQGTGVDLTPVSNWSYTGGTDLEFATIGKRDYAIAPAQGSMGGLRIFDLTANPAKPKLVGFLPCPVSQNDVPVRGTTVFMGVDGSVKDAECFAQAQAAPALGVLAIDISKPTRPRGVGFVPTNNNNITCTAHVLDYGPSGKTFSNAGYAAGVRIIDATSRVGLPSDLATFTALDADTWSAKQYKNPKCLYANDLARGFDVYEYTEGKGAVDTRSAKQIQYNITRVGASTFSAARGAPTPRACSRARPS